MAFFEAREVTVDFGGRRALDGVSFSLEKGMFTALLGPNGSGKSTLLKACAGLLKAGRGQVLLEGKDLWSLDARGRARAVAYVAPDLVAEFPITARETVMLGRIAGGRGLLSLPGSGDDELVREAMERCRCWGLRDRELHSLSGGERQLVSLAKSLVQKPAILLLDETLSRMDLDHQAEMGLVLQALSRDRGVAVVLVAHDVNLATEWARECVLLRDGHVLASGPVEKAWTTENLRALYPRSKLKIEGSGKPRVFLGD